MPYPNNKNKGVILITVLIFVMIVSLLAVSVLFIMSNDARLTEANIKRIQASYASYAGIQHYLELLKTNASPGEVPLSVDGFNVTVNMYALPAVPAGCPSPTSGSMNADCILATCGY